MHGVGAVSSVSGGAHVLSVSSSGCPQPRPTGLLPELLEINVGRSQAKLSKGTWSLHFFLKYSFTHETQDKLMKIYARNPTSAKDIAGEQFIIKSHSLSVCSALARCPEVPENMFRV